MNNTNNTIHISKMTAQPDLNHTVSTVPFDYVGTLKFLVGVSDTRINPGQYQYLAFCSADQEPKGVAIQVPYNNGIGVSGILGFTGSGNFYSRRDPQIAADSNSRVITINP
ncbi:MAG TPA: hypothetical protein VHZ55_33630 [Bryobacteraceae bacterium]|nr:hypothetical protein [Bryobacteraceae bacterium]